MFDFSLISVPLDFFSAPVEANRNSKDSDIDIDAGDDMPPEVPSSFNDPSFDNTNSTPVNLSAAPIAMAAPTMAANYDIKEEAASITAWKKEFANRLQELDDKETKQMADWEEKAKQDLEDWRRRRQEALEKQRQVNLEVSIQVKLARYLGPDRVCVGSKTCPLIFDLLLIFFINLPITPILERTIFYRRTRVPIKRRRRRYRLVQSVKFMRFQQQNQEK